MFFTGKHDKLSYDKTREEPVIHRSICTGETTVGFVDVSTRKFRDIRRVDSEKDIATFCRETGIERDKIRTIY
ncbi:MAG: aspartate dehydrogenase [Saccharofermentans sp.]|nr:aspartate dehydrogenase [Saccharofermentans sp.]